MKRDAPLDPQPRCTMPTQQDEVPTPLDGTWEMSASRAQAGEMDAGDYRMALRRGRVWTCSRVRVRAAGAWNGSFRVRRQRIFFHYGDGSSAVYTWNVFRDTLTLRIVPGVAEAPNPTFAPWYRVGS